MKKLVSGMLALVLGAATVCAVTACNDSYETYTVYAPDGAPALALANAVQEEGEGENFDFRIVDSSTIAAQVQGETPNADFCPSTPRQSSSERGRPIRCSAPSQTAICTF